MNLKRVALVGTPNAGKTALFNALTQSHQRVANYSGVTVESAEADLVFHSGEKAILVDLPGAYSMRPYTEDENVLKNALTHEAFDGMILVVDATQPVRAIRFLIEVLNATRIPAVVALNMIDLAKQREFEYDLIQYAGALGIAVIPTAATKKTGFQELLNSLDQAIANQQRQTHQFFPDSVTSDSAEEILKVYKLADDLSKRVLIRQGQADERSRKIDRIVLHPVWGMFILLTVLAVTFQLMFNLAQVPMDLIDDAFKKLSDLANHLPLPELVKSFLADGVIAGVGSTLVFLPQILILFGLILFLEDFGFMARAVFLLDHLMGRVGLHSRSFLPLLSSYACNVPGILATKTIESRRDRVVTTLIIPLTTCSARIPVYTLLISAFIPNATLALGIKLQGLVMLSLYAVGIFFALLMGALFKKTLLRGATPPLLIELPSYKFPSLSSLGKGLLYRIKLFLKRVGTVILTMSIVIWALVTFPRAPEGTANPVESSFAAKIGHFVEPAIRPLGFDWKIGMALIPTFAAREVMVSTLATVYSVAEDSAVSNTDRLSDKIKSEWSVATGLSLIAWFIFAPMCMSTLATVRRELRSTGWMLFSLVYLFGFAYLASFVTYHIAKS